MSCHVGHVGDIAVARGDQIDEVATDALAGPREPVDLIERSNAVNQGHECLLDAVGQFQLVLHADGRGCLILYEGYEGDVREDQESPDTTCRNTECRNRSGKMEVSGIGKPTHNAGPNCVEGGDKPDPRAGMADEQPRVENRVSPVCHAQREHEQQGQTLGASEVHIEAVNRKQEEDRQVEAKQAAGRQGAERSPGVGATAIPRNVAGKGSGTHAPPK
jgi:hypothetical protein